MRVDALYVNGNITTGDPCHPRARSLAVWQGKVIGADDQATGCDADMVVDLRGATVVPGFHDAHHHLSWRGQLLRQLDLSAPGVSGLEQLYRTVAGHAASVAPGEWLLGRGYDQNQLGGHPTRARLDEVAGDLPVWLRHKSGHMGVLNTEGFRRLGFSADLGADLAAVPDVPGGYVERDVEGRPTGLLAEAALRLVFAVLRPEPFEDFVTGIGLASQTALAEGITSITEPGIAGALAGNSPADLAAFLAARRRGLLGVRVTLMPEASALHDIGVFETDRRWFGLDLGLHTGLGDDWLRVGATKIIADGSLIGRTAAMCCAYHDEPTTSGFMLHEPEWLRETILAAHCHGWQVAVHAIGDATLQVVLEAYEDAQRRAPRVDVRHRIEHCAVASDDNIARIAALGAIPVPQARFISEIGDGMLRALGPDRGRLCYRQKSFLDAGLVLPGSSDAPVVAAAPLLGIHDLVNQRTSSGRPFNPAEALTVEQALRAYSYGSAYADHQEHHKGQLTRGRLADLVVLSEDIHATDPANIASISVVATIVDGVPVFGAHELKVI